MNRIISALALTGVMAFSTPIFSATAPTTNKTPQTQKPINWQLEKASGEMPSGRGGGKLIPIGNQLIAIGGFHECFDKDKANCDHVFFDEVYLYNIQAKKWSRKKPTSSDGKLPGGRVFMGAAPYLNNKTAIIFGGTKYHVNVTTVKPYSDDAVFKVYDDMWEYDPAKNSFTQIKYSNQGPNARLGAEIVIKGDTLYLFGGYDISFKNHNDLWSFNLKDKTWKQLKQDDDPSSPSKRYIFRFDLDDKGENAYIFGGNFREKATVQRKDLWKYNIPNNQFTEIVSEAKSNIPGRTHGAAAWFDNQYILAFGDIPEGGCNVNQASEQQNPTNEVWTIHTDKNTPQWERVKIGTGPSPLKRVFYAKSGDRLYVTLGYDYKCSGKQDIGHPVYNEKMYSLPLKEIGKNY